MQLVSKLDGNSGLLVESRTRDPPLEVRHTKSSAQVL